MEKLDPGMLPEPFRSMFLNIDPAVLEQLRDSIDPAALLGLLGGAADMVRQSLNTQDSEALQQLLSGVAQLLNPAGK
ncbi:hypothetical protein [Desulfotomaculum copahuensis]|uniref:Uncharacterized protein n=1 Tax=Desulfotomaculum copahuensis TaxID=1838280 RepID=A0A1B7LE24_9FIRM|nr:hypothetical protein [Desulfotomaculum copahuensis]OAT81340.1 hypothetical protein A6M21_10685 [Desulfotomaculum copahuensis]